MRDRLTLYVVRGLFLLICGGIGLLLGQRLEGQGMVSAWTVPIALLAGVMIVGVEAVFSRSSIKTISAIVFGLLVGFAASALFSPVIEVIVERIQLSFAEGDQDRTQIEAALGQVKFVLQLAATALFCYFGITLLLQTQDQFKFLIPYVEFRSEVKGLRPILVDTSVVLEGHLGPLAATGFFESRLVIPSFVAREIQQLADSGDARKRALGERGLALLKDLVTQGYVEVQSFAGLEDGDVDELLIRAAHLESGRLLTRDQKLEGRAELEGITTVFLPRVIEALRPNYDQGDDVEIEILRQGEEEHQGVGFLPDGTMVVVDQGAAHVGSRRLVEIRRVVPTQAGRILFARQRES